MQNKITNKRYSRKSPKTILNFILKTNCIQWLTLKYHIFMQVYIPELLFQWQKGEVNYWIVISITEYRTLTFIIATWCSYCYFSSTINIYLRTERLWWKSQCKKISRCLQFCAAILDFLLGKKELPNLFYNETIQAAVENKTKYY